MSGVSFDFRTVCEFIRVLALCTAAESYEYTARVLTSKKVIVATTAPRRSAAWIRSTHFAMHRLTAALASFWHLCLLVQLVCLRACSLG